LENTSNALAGPIPAGSLDRTPFKAWIMGKSPSASDSRSSDSRREYASARDGLAETTRDKVPMPPGLMGSCTLRVKPDRRRVQIPIDRERRRTR
jgi:hypothetical protein